MGLVLAVAAVLPMVGCGPPTGTVTGTVVLKGGPNGDQTLKGGTITFYSADGKTVGGQAEIQENGTYKVDKVPAGDSKVVVSTEMLNQQGKGRAGPPPGTKVNPNDPNADPAAKAQARYVAIPLKYADPEQSGLKFTVKAGSNTYDPPLTAP
ncbi:MAG TPA: hypothetical protein VMS17_14500 [Gemmataceae bacterium]|nr:hypothetical protein [Gemmataceae bacterium]